MKSIYHFILALVVAFSLPFGLMAQNSLPAPGSGDSFTPDTGGGFGGGGGFGPGPGWGGPGPGWGGGPNWNNGPYWNIPWYDSGVTYSPTIVVQPSASFPNQGTEKVIACGYDAQGIWRVFPMFVSYVYNGVKYDVNVLNTFNPWTDSWDNGVDEPAYSTSHYLRNVLYKFYTNLSFGTFYFNL